MKLLSAGWDWLRLVVIVTLLGAGVFVCGEEYQARNDAHELAESDAARQSAQDDAQYWQQADLTGLFYYNALSSYMQRDHKAK